MSCHQPKEKLEVCQCSCPPSNFTCINNHSKGLHVDIHRGLFASSKRCNRRSADKILELDDDWYNLILKHVKWHRVKYKSSRFQKECTTPCYTAFYGGREEYRPYTPIPDWIQPLIEKVTSHLNSHQDSNDRKVTFNAFLLRLYFDGNDEIAWHTDGRTFLGEEPTIASLSLGCKATFQLRRMNNVWPCADGSQSTEGCVDVTTPVESFVLQDGDLLVMRGKTQKYWHHRVPKEKGRGVRLNINFRYVMPGLDAERGQQTYYKYMVFGDCPVDSEPPNWTFQEIMSKKGGMMNFVQRPVDREKGSLVGKRGNPDRIGKEAVVHVGPSNRSKDRKQKSTFDTDDETQQYLSSSCNENVDRDVFLALPKEIRQDLISSWKSQQQSVASVQPNSTNQHAPISSKHPSKKRKQSVGKPSKTSKPAQLKGGIESFFAKK